MELINAGEPGNTAEKGLARLEKDVISHSPDYILIIFGAEDVLAGIEINAFEKNLENIVDEIAAKNIRPILMTPAPISERFTVKDCSIHELRNLQERSSLVGQVAKSLAEKKSLPLIPE